MAKKNKDRSFLPWLTTNPNGFHENEKRFLQIPQNMFFANSKFGFPEMNYSSKWLYLCMACESGGEREFKFSHSTAKKFGFNKNTFDKCVKELIEKKLIEVIEDPDRNQFKSKQFRFTPEEWKLEHTKKAFERNADLIVENKNKTDYNEHK